MIGLLSQSRYQSDSVSALMYNSDYYVMMKIILSTAGFMTLKKEILTWL